MEPLRIDWLQAWDQHVDPERQRHYVANELRRIQAEGAPLLYAALTLPFVQQIDLAVSVMRKTLNVHSATLALVAGAVPRPDGPYGELLPPALRGKVLRAKVGVAGQALPGEQITELEARRYSGPAYRAMRDRYRTIDITHEPTSVPIDDAIVILRAYGHGVPDHQWRRRKRAKPGEPAVQGFAGEAIDLWIVGEVSPMTRAAGLFGKPADEPVPTPPPPPQSYERNRRSA